jgi:prevent-host-death family protein
LKAKLSAYLKHVQAGEEVLVLSHGKPVARIVPIDPDSKMAHDEWIKELIRTGRIRPATKKLPPDFWDRPKPKDPEGLVRKAIIEERREGR